MRFWPRKSHPDEIAPVKVTDASHGPIRVSDLLSTHEVLMLKESATFQDACALLVGTWKGGNAPAVLEAIMAREKLGATRIEGEILLPHARLEGFGPVRAALGISPQGLAGLPDVRIVLLFAGDRSRPREPLAFLSSAAALFSREGVKARLLANGLPQTVFNVLREAESEETL